MSKVFFVTAAILCIVLASTLTSTLLSLATLTETLSSGRIAFDCAPRFVRCATSSTQLGQIRTTYHFTLTVPDDAGAELQSIAIEQIFSSGRIKLYLDRTRAFEGNSSAGGTAVMLTPIQTSATEEAVAVQFDLLISPGRTVTAALEV